MDYLTRQDFLDKYNERDLIRLTNEDNTGSEVEWSVVDRIIVDASEKIDEYISNRYDTSDIVLNNTLKRACMFLSVYYLKYRKGIADESDLNQYKEAISYLEQVRDGKLLLTRNIRKDVNIYSEHKRKFTLYSKV